MVVGDLTALPAINSLIEAAPAHVRVSAAIEDAHVDHHARLPVSSHPQLEAAWIVPAVRDHGSEFASWMRCLDVDPADLWVRGAGERGLVETVRSVCKDVWRLDRSRHFTRAYWIKARAGR